MHRAGIYNLISSIGQNPIVDIIAFWPNDELWEQCRCEKCARHSKVENYTYFQNEVASVSAVYPTVKIDMLVYVDLWEYPEGETLQNSLLIDEATHGRRAAAVESLTAPVYPKQH
ncbi:MAG: hypothetical protein ACLR23_02685 [Clostridia bacterium]